MATTFQSKPGMVRSFGYKNGHYDISKRVGDELVTQISGALSTDKAAPIPANGTSCLEQISSEVAATIRHPMQFLETLLA